MNDFSISYITFLDLVFFKRKTHVDNKVFHTASIVAPQ